MDRNLVNAAFDAIRGFGRHLTDASQKKRYACVIQAVERAEHSMGRYKPNSIIYKKIETMWGKDGPPNHGKLWTQEDWDRLFDMFLDGASAYDLCYALGRSLKGIELKFELTCRRNDSGRNYPIELATTKRSGLHYSDRDNYIISQACSGKGIETKAYHADYLGALLRRDPAAVTQYMQVLAEKRRLANNSFRLGQYKSEIKPEVEKKGKTKEETKTNADDAFARRVFEELKSIVSKIDTEFGFGESRDS